MIRCLRVALICGVLQLLLPLIKDYKQKDGLVAEMAQVYGEGLLVMELMIVVKMKKERMEVQIKEKEFHSN